MKLYRRIFYRPFFIRLTHWEFWSFGMIYGWILPYWFYLCLKARSFFFFSASNPSIEYGGFANESKEDIYPLIPPGITPKSIFFKQGADAAYVAGQLHEQGMSLPLVGKPNKGGKGKGVKILRDAGALNHYVQHAIVDFHIQELVPYEKEVGIFYYRMPGEEKGKITGIVRKEFLSVTGDGKSTVRQLIDRNPRAILHLKSITKMHPGLLDKVLANNEIYVLVPYGNHARGAMFKDDSHLIDEQLEDMMNDTCKKIEGFYFGRLDIKFHDWNELKQGKHFSIIEVNGAGSEPTHIYDPKHSIFFAWKELTRHWKILYKISRINHRLGHPYLSWKEGTNMFRQDKINISLLEKMTD